MEGLDDCESISMELHDLLEYLYLQKCSVNKCFENPLNEQMLVNAQRCLKVMISHSSWPPIEHCSVLTRGFGKIPFYD